MMARIVDIAAARQRKADDEPLAYLPGVTPFDRSNPVHVRAWNTLHQLGWSEQRFQERERRGNETERPGND
jgi:hypothetical protein